MNDHLEILRDFEPITLQEMEGVKLMNRTDTKFIFNIAQFDDVMRLVKDDYRVLEIAGKKHSRYETLYYDTTGFDLYKQHHKGKLNRYKIRHRTYVDTDAGFLEVKFKNNKGRTIKTRISKKDVPYGWAGDSLEFLEETLPFAPGVLTPVIWINYNRITLVSRKSAERLTIDLGLEFKRGDVHNVLNGLVIAEVKQEKRQASAFMNVMKKKFIREGSISKYCMGIAFTCEDVKKNNFKSKLKTIKSKNQC
jgi:hypothetical protein